mgnify:CR=1 FL=1
MLSKYFETHQQRNRIFGFFVFAAALILYCITIAPTTSFWDSGEYIAVANKLEVPHPPGNPFFILLGRLFSMFMPTFWVAISVNFISALSSALTVMLLYLITVRLIGQWKGNPDSYDKVDLISTYGGAMIGAFTFAVTDSFWFNAVETEMYALSMFFTAIVVWLSLKWADEADQPGHERWLVVIAFCFGLALGVHLLNLLTLFFVAVVVYFRKYAFRITSFLMMMAISSVSFLLIYPFTVKKIPGLIDDVNIATYGLVGPVTYFFIIIGIVALGVYYTHKNNYRIANLIFVSYTVILLGYSAYALIFIRSMADPPIDENDPETVEAFESYLQREQYGQTPLLTGHTYSNSQERVNRDEEVWFPRRHSSQPRHQRKYAEYSSDWAFFLDYQIQHMYIRYFNWQFIGRVSDIQDAGWQAGFTETRHEDNPAHNSYYYLPFLLGIFGLIFHFQNDWKRALSVFVLFFMTGLAIIIYLNQTPFQPRERDYAYVGSFFAYSIWIGLGATGLVQLVKHYLGKTNLAQYTSYGVLLLTFLGVPFLMGSQNFDDHDRSGRYVAADYAENLLRSTAPNSIIFTNGDNDTFPLWYAQEVEGVRTDVRVVCLSLLNTDWYIKQLKNQWSHNSPPLPIDMSDEKIENLEDKFNFNSPDDFYQPKTHTIPVDKELLKEAFADSNAYREKIGVSDTSLNVYEKEISFGVPLDSLDDQVSFYFEGHFLGKNRNGQKLYYTRIQDDIIMNILENNNWLRPVYFATTVARESQMNLQNYFRLEGQAYRVVPNKHPNANYGYIVPEFHTKRLKKFKFREMDNPDVYFNHNIRRMLDNYRFSFTQLANEYMDRNQPDSALHWLKWGQDNIPFKSVQGDMSSMVSYAYRYARLGALDRAFELAQRAESSLLDDLDFRMNRYNEYQSKIGQLQSRVKTAKKNANYSLQQKLQNELEKVQSSRKNQAQQISYATSRLIYVQRIYYMADKDQKAQDLASQVNDLTMNQLSFPSSESANKQQVDRMPMGF